MTITWKQELNLLNDEQLGRIAYADEDSWESQYCGNEDNGNKCCVMGHILNLTWPTMYKLTEYREQLGERPSPLQLFYDEFCFLSNTTEQRKEMLKERVTLIQNEAKRILEERKQRVAQEQEIVII